MNQQATLSKFFARVSKLTREQQDHIRLAYERAPRLEWAHYDAMACWAVTDIYPSFDRSELRHQAYMAAADVAPISWAAASAAHEIVGSYDDELKRGMRDFFFLPLFGIRDLADLSGFAIPSVA